MQVMAQVDHVEPQQHQLYYLAGQLKEQDISQKVLKLMLYHAAKPNLLLKLPLLYLINNSKSYYHLGYIDGLAEITNSDIEYVYHHHTDDCLGTVTKTCTITKRFTTENHPAAWNSIWCGTCNANTYHDGMKITHSSCGQATDYQILNCSRHADNSNYYSTSTHTYTGTGYICGYNEGDIEKATIVIKK